ncbi:MAG: AIR synthase-related protein [Bacteroidetes bacterium]|nr:AIR synthase-related protein [Bacteroidota bacterium]
MSLYAQRGVSAQKEEVHAAIQDLDQGLYPNAFCKLYADFLGKDAQHINIMHADGAGTKSILAYIYWRETGDTSIWKGIAQDAIAMNLDDLLCVGIYDQILFSSTIDRNKLLINGTILQELIQGTQGFFNELKAYGINIEFLGGETADVGDVVRTIAVNGTMTARWPKSKLITNDLIAPGQVIVGFSSYGQAAYETAYNSGLGSNGLTSARHDVLHHDYATKYPETFEPTLKEEVVYLGKNKMTDEIEIEGFGKINIGKLLLSPTRTYAPLVKEILTHHFDAVKGMIHCSGGGQTKCMKYLPGPMRLVKNNFLPVPPIFKLIQENSGANTREMYQVFNMGHRLEIFTEANNAQALIDLAKTFNIQAQIIGKVEASTQKELILSGDFGQETFNY